MAEGKFPNVQEYLKQWSTVLIEQLRKSAVNEMNENKAKAKFPGEGDPAGSALVAGMHTSMLVFGTKVEAHIILPESWYWLEHGRKPGKMPPADPIIKWMVHRAIGKIDRKRVKGIKNRTVRKGLKQLDVYKQRKSLAFLIRKKIAKHGTRETKFFSNVVTPQLIGDLKATIKEKFNKDIRIDLITGFE